MNNLKYYNKKDNLFAEYFIEKEKDLLITLNYEAYKDKILQFYIGWYAHTMDEYICSNYNISEYFTNFFLNNETLDIKFYIYIMDRKFRNKMIKDIKIYKRKFRKDNIYE